MYVTLLANRVFIEIIEVSRVSLIQYNWYSYKKGNLDKIDFVTIKSEVRVMHVQGKEQYRSPENHH
jgi:hypothetical protein